MKTKITLFLSIILLMLSQKTTAQTLSQNNWTSYCGWHYGKTPAWGGWVRDFVSYKTGMDLIDTIGTTLVIDTVQLDNLFNSLTTINSSVDLLLTDGALGKAKDTVKAKVFVDMIDADSAAFWKSLVYKQFNKLAQLPGSQNRLYYQLGNEITSAALSKSLRYVQNMPYAGGFDYDQFNIPFFVEKYMAPTLEAIDSASLFNYGAKGKINICLGSITNAGNSAALPFTNALLNYTITGTYAPSLAGKKVYELIHIITLHYIMGNSSSNVWQNRINDYANWFGMGRIRGVWSTEEVGINKASSGAGAAYSARASFRYLKWAIDSSFTSSVVRTNYWAWDVGLAGTQVSDFNSELYNFLGDIKLSYVKPIYSIYTNTTDLEWHGFLNSTSNKGILAVLSPSASISQIKLVNNGWGNISSVSLTRYDTTGNSNIPVTLSFLTDSVTLTFPTQNISIETVLLFKINTQPLSVGIASSELTDNNLILYPNPVTESLSIDYIASGNKIESVMIYNSLGSKVFSTLTPNNTQTINMRNWAKGLYYINILSTDGKKHKRKVIVQQ